MNDLHKANKLSLKLFAFIALLVVVSAATSWIDLNEPQRWLTLGGVTIVTGMLFVVSASVHRFGSPENSEHLTGQLLVIVGGLMMLYTMFFGI